MADKKRHGARQVAADGSANRGLGDVAGWQSLLVFSVLTLACLAGFVSRLFAVIRFESIIHEFDPWFNYRATAYMVRHGFYSFLNWFDDRAWYPLGRIVGGTVYPGLMLTSGALHYVLHSLHIPVHIRDVCVFLAPCFSGLTALAAYALTCQLWSVGAGLLAACFIAIAPGYISRSVAGSYDNEGIAICALLTTYACWLRALRTGSVLWATLTALAYGYMVSAWGGYVFIINLVPLHVFVLIIMQRFSSRLFVSYTVFFAVGLLCSMQVPFVGFQPVRTSEHMAAIGVFVLVVAQAALLFIRDQLSARLTRAHWRHLLVVALAVCAACVALAVVALTQAGYVAPWSGRFYSLWDTGYAKIHIPIIASVSEHQPTTWVSFFFDLHVLVCLFPAGIWFCIKRVDDLRVFLILYAVSASYFAGVMVRLILTLTPVVCVSAAIAFSRLFDTFLRDDSRFPDADADADADAQADASTSGTTRKKRTRPPAVEAAPSDAAKKRKPKDRDRANDSEKSDAETDADQSSPDELLGVNVKSIAVVVLVMTLLLFAVHCTWVTSNAYSSPSVVLASYNQDGSRNILDDFREAYFWLWQNTDENARVMSWWDYGYQIAGMGNRTTLVDNNTWNNSHIALVGKAMSSNETEAYKIMRRLDVDYVLVIFGGVIGYSGDDINKFLWMVRIAEGEHPKEIRETDYFSASGEYRIDREASETMLNSLMYKMSYWRFGEMQTDFRTPAGYDRTRGAEIGRKSYSLSVLEEAFTSEHWLVRIFKVLPPPNRPRVTKLRRRLRTVLSRKSPRSLLGTLKFQPLVVKGRVPKSVARATK